MTFDDFWNGNLSRGWKRYPRRAKRPLTLKAYEAALTKATHEEIMEGLQAALRAEYMSLIEQNRFSYIPHSYNWLKNEQWNDHSGPPVDIETGLRPDQIARWEKVLAEGGAVPEGIKRLLRGEPSVPLSNVVKFNRK